MNKTEDYFSFTTADEQSNYFSGEIQQNEVAGSDSEALLIPGNYRIIDGKLCQIISGVPQNEIRDRLNTILKEK